MTKKQELESEKFYGYLNSFIIGGLMGIILMIIGFVFLLLYLYIQILFWIALVVALYFIVLIIWGLFQ